MLLVFLPAVSALLILAPVLVPAVSALLVLALAVLALAVLALAVLALAVLLWSLLVEGTLSLLFEVEGRLSLLVDGPLSLSGWLLSGGPSMMEDWLAVSPRTASIWKGRKLNQWNR
jgi:hypothetical protein